MKMQQCISLEKYNSLFYITRKVQNSVSVRERQRQGDGVQTGGGLLYSPFLNLHCDSIFRAICLCFLDERFSTGVHCGLLHSPQPWVAPNAASTLTWLWLQLADCDSMTDYWYLCITPTHSGCNSHDLLLLVHSCKLSSC